MANKTLKSASFFAILFIIFLLIAASEMRMVEAKLCEKRSKTWSGRCTKTTHCDNQCRKWEYAKHGACHADGFLGLGRACFCYFKC